MIPFKLCLGVFYIFCCLSERITGQIRDIDGKTALELPVYRTEHPADLLLRYAEEHGYSLDALNKTAVSRSLFRDITADPVKNETIAIFKSYDADYYTKIGIGKPAQYINLLVDTTWTDSWVISTECHGWNCVMKNKYNTSISHTAHPDPEGRKFFIDFGNDTFGGNLTGNLVIDTMIFAHHNASNVTFAEVSNIPWYMYFTRYDGILGMGKSTQLMGGALPIWRELIQQNKIKSNIFSLYYNRDPTIPRAGSILIGTWDPHHYNGSASEEVQVTSDDYWQFSIKDLQLYREKKHKNKKRKPLVHFCKDSCYAQIDSGGNAITGPAAQIKQINDIIGAEPFFLGYHRVPCENIAKLPELVFTFGRKEIILYGEHYVQQIFYRGYSLCLSTFWPRNGTDPYWSFGIPLLSKYYTIFNFDRNTIEITDYKSSKIYEEESVYKSDNIYVTETVKTDRNEIDPEVTQDKIYVLIISVFASMFIVTTIMCCLLCFLLGQILYTRSFKGSYPSGRSGDSPSDVQILVTE